MARIAGVDLPRGKRADIALTYIYGIGRVTALKILDASGVNWTRGIDDLTAEELNAEYIIPKAFDRRVGPAVAAAVAAAAIKTGVNRI